MNLQQQGASHEAGPEVRLPLQIGTTSLWSLGRTALVLVPAIALLPFSLFLEDGLFGGLAAGALLIFYGGMHARFAIRERSSDVLLSKRGLRIEGGRFHGLWAHWENVERARCHLDETTEKRPTLWGIFTFLVSKARKSPLRDVPVMRLRLVPRHGEALVVAQAERPIEMESMRALLESIQTGPWGEADKAQLDRRAHDNRARQAQLGIHVLACPECGAPAAPAEQPFVKCRYCGAAVAVPPEMAGRIAASRRVAVGRTASSDLVKKLLKQPGAHETNSRIMLLAVPMLLAWPLAIVALLARWGTDTLTSVDLAALPIAPFLVVAGLFAVLRASLVDRQALRLLTLDFGAQPPLRKGDPHTCRRCGAPLEERPGEVLVVCAYCSCDNVLGLDLGREVAPTEHQARSLEEAFRGRASEARLWGVLKVTGFALLVVALAGYVLGAGASMAIDDPIEDGASEKAAAPAPQVTRPVAPQPTAQRPAAPQPKPSVKTARPHR